MENIILELRMSLLLERGNSVASTHKVDLGLVWKAPKANLRKLVWMGFSNLRTDLEARLYTETFYRRGWSR